MNLDYNNFLRKIDFNKPPPGYSALGIELPRSKEPIQVFPLGPKNQSEGNGECINLMDQNFPVYPNLSLPNTRPQNSVPPKIPYTSYLPSIPSQTTIPVDIRRFNSLCPQDNTVLDVPSLPSELDSIRIGQTGNSHFPQFQLSYSSVHHRNSNSDNYNGKRKKHGWGKTRNVTKRKPLALNKLALKKIWSYEDAKRALKLEMNFIKFEKYPTLVLKFPDEELNEDIVSRFHSEIESVILQQPYMPRFCTVTLKDTSCTDEVIQDLRRVKFGNKYLTVENKEDISEEIEKIDPFTLFVGNLAKEVTMTDITKLYSRYEYIHVGYTDKDRLKYAFVLFGKVNDALEAFQRTRATEMYNNTLIVRFWRWPGEDGSPGDPNYFELKYNNEVEANIIEVNCISDSKDVTFESDDSDESVIIID